MAPTKPANFDAKKAASAGATSVRRSRRIAATSYRRDREHEAITCHDDGENDDSTESSTNARESHALLSAKQRAWWMVEGSAQGATTTLVKRCIREYGWDLPKSQKVLTAYKQFLFLKKELADWDSKLLSPCHLVDQMWHQHILNVFNYHNDMVLLCGRLVVGHEPDGAFDFADKLRRDQFTMKCLIYYFGSCDVNIWGPAPITIIIEDQHRKELLFKVNMTTPMSRAFNVVAQRKQVSVSSLRFMGDDGNILGSATAETLNLEDEDRIYVYDSDVHASITITIKDYNREDYVFKIKMTTRMSKVFNVVAQRKRVSVTLLSFMGDDGIISGGETAAALKLEDGDQIHVFSGNMGNNMVM